MIGSGMPSSQSSAPLPRPMTSSIVCTWQMTRDGNESSASLDGSGNTRLMRLRRSRRRIVSSSRGERHHDPVSRDGRDRRPFSGSTAEERNSMRMAD